MNKIAALILAGALVVGIVVGFTQRGRLFPSAKKSDTSSNKIIRIGLSLDALKELRWAKDRSLMSERAEELGGSVVSFVADSDDATQISQIENLISQKVDVIIIVAHNASALSGVVDEAHKAGIKVIGYDRMILNSDLDMYISFDSEKVGKYAAQYVMDAAPKTDSVLQVAFIGGSETDNNAFLVKKGAMSVLDPLVTEGKAKVVFDQFTKDWNSDVAYNNLKKFLDEGGNVDAVVGSNDGIALGAVQALSEKNLSGKIPVSGQDAELAAVKRLIEGTQTVTLYKPIAALAYKAIDTAFGMAKGDKVQTNGAVNNGKIDVPAFLIDPVPVTKDNIKDTVIKDGFYTEQDVYGSK